jgi:uncharacterized protein YbbK (DUF523 family)
MAQFGYEKSFFCEQISASKPAVAISACLAGEAVRYDGGDEKLETALSLMRNYLELIPICPEVGAGMSVPRPAIQLVRHNNIIEALGRDDSTLNVTHSLQRFSESSVERYSDQLCAYILKSRSPSCGLDSTPVFNKKGQSIAVGSGIQAEYFRQQMPWLLMCDEHQLHTEAQCQHFILSCLILKDVYVGSREQGIGPLHQYYESLIDRMGLGVAHRLQESMSHLQCYWSVFKDGLATLSCEDLIVGKGH